MKTISVPTAEDLMSQILEPVSKSIQENVVLALEPLIRNQTQSENRVNSQLSDLEAQIAGISRVFSQNRASQHFQCDLCDRTFGNQRNRQNHRRTNHLPNPT